MLYIFHVDTGTTITFDIKLALQSVSQLKEAIERECGVVAAHQVLLMSGGESLEPNARVCSYSAGTDTNPIYLFSKAAIESHIPPTPSIDYGSDVDLQSQIDSSLAMPATYHTLIARAQLAQQCCGLAREQTRICERLVHDQHLQQQGWAAVVANLEDITQMFQSRAELLQQSFSLYLRERQQHMELLNNFNADLGTLSKIPILPALRAQAEGLLSPEEQPATEDASENREEVLSLLKWISAKDNQSSLEQVAEQCSRGLEQFDERVMESLKVEVNAAVDSANKQDMKEIKGLGERLYALEQLMAQTKKLVHEQGELAQGFLQNQNRANNLGDASVLPDLCTSHRRQLLVMLQNHNQLRDIRRRCTRAKEELSVNIYHRLKWIMYVENKMMEVDGKLVMYHESLKRLRRHLEVLQQIHLAPQMYVSAVAEVVRRRTFSQAFLVWASNLACQLLAVHSEELARRRDFQNKFDGHFLNTLFPGLEDTPPPFATQAPSVFDNGLPKLTLDDMESLKDQLPDLAFNVSTPDLNSITQFFLSKSHTETTSEENKDKEGQSAIHEATKQLDSGRAPMLGDRGGFESETDTEEFEKIGQAGTDVKINSFDSLKQKRQKQLEVGASQSASPTSSTSTNLSPLNSKVVDLNRSSSSSEPGSFHFPSLTTSERPSQLSPLTECVENCESSLHQRFCGNDNFSKPCPVHSDHPESLNNTCSLTQPLVCGGEQQQQQQQQQRQQSGSGGSSPSACGGVVEFMGTEYYMDESLPSSLSEHPGDGHQAIVNLLQENLGNTRGEVERLRSLLRTMKTVAGDTLVAFRKELATLREKTTYEKNGMAEMTERVRQAVVLHSGECDRALREREQELTVDHELEMADLKKHVQNREDEISSLKQSLREKETDLSEHERLISTMRQKMDSEQAEVRSLQSRLRHVGEALEHAREEKEAALKEANEAKLMEIASLTNSLTQCQDRVRELEDSLVAARAEQQRMVKEVTDKLQMDYKIEVDTLRSRFKRMTASTMERTPSDSTLEKIERPDMIELANHEAILAQANEDMKSKMAASIRSAVEKERSDCAAKLDHELRLAKQRNDTEKQVWFNEAMRTVVEEKDREMELHRTREISLAKECERYKDTIRRLTESESMVENLEADKVVLEANMAAERKMFEQLESKVHDLEVERDKLRQELNDERLKMSQSGAGLEEAFSALEAQKDKLKAQLDNHRKSDEVEVSESKKVRLEEDGEIACLSGRVEMLENENNRLTAELRLTRESKKTADEKVEALEADKVRLEVELVKERSRRGYDADASSSSISTAEAREKEMNASVAVVSESLSRDAATSPEPNRRDAFFSSHMREKLTKSTLSSIQQNPITFTSCNPGDVVLVAWDPPHKNYMLVQDSNTLFFLNSDCNDALDLRINPDGNPERSYAIAKVVDKEYCHAKKSENRYKVPQGTKFYRVRVKPVQKEVEIVPAKSQQ
ncbi:RB1-inducible coiled-coil protein 1 isoform X2 [Cephus cinctus]|uniref:RB1-inducible coiled-coil protein 1 n=1 Tax=Cephus cinctus TaxID=211228 RepID=A0AAJ7FTM5_CEPCN|nr:RB1-inducible coiled-coil protein 1 isoform X2 [Cephus cinctus]